MCYTTRNSRPTRCLFVLLLGCLQSRVADVTSTHDATYIGPTVADRYSAESGGPSAVVPCGNLQTGCKRDGTTMLQIPRRLPLVNHLLEKRSKYELDSLPDTVLSAEMNDGMRKMDTRYGYRSIQDNRPSHSRLRWNVPFRVLYGDGMNVVKHTQRSSGDGVDGYREGRFKFGRRSEIEEKRMFKFGKREDYLEDDSNLEIEEQKRMFKFGKRSTEWMDNSRLSVGEEKKMFKFGKRTDGFSDDHNRSVGEEKRLFKFGKRTEDTRSAVNLSEGEDKRMFKFGKRTDDIQVAPYLTGDEEKKRMFKFGKRTDDIQVAPYLTGDEEKKRMFKFGKRTDDIQVAPYLADDEEKKRMFKFGKRTDDIQVAPYLTGDEEKKRMFKFGKRTKSLSDGSALESGKEKPMFNFSKKSDGFRVEKLMTLGADPKRLVQFPEARKQMLKFGKQSDPIDESFPLWERKRKIMFGKKDETMMKDDEQQLYDGELESMKTDTGELGQNKRKPKFPFGKRLAASLE